MALLIRYAPEIAAAAAAVALLGFIAHDQRERGREAERLDQAERRHQLEETIDDAYDQNARDAAGGDVERILRDGRARHAPARDLP